MKRATLYTVAVLLTAIAIAIWCVANPGAPPALRPAPLEDSTRSKTRVTSKLHISELRKLSRKERSTEINTVESSAIEPRAAAHGVVPERSSVLLAADSFSALREVAPGELYVVYSVSGAIDSAAYRDTVFTTVGRTVAVKRR